MNSPGQVQTELYFIKEGTQKSYEEWQNGGDIDTNTPFWRVLDPKSSFAKKLTFGKELLMEMREKEGI